MTRITAKKGTVRSAGGWEQYLRDQMGLRDDVELTNIKDGGMHGSVTFVFDTPGGVLEASGYISSPPVATYKMRVYGDRIRALFDTDYEGLDTRKKAATTGFEDVEK